MDTILRILFESGAGRTPPLPAPALCPWGGEDAINNVHLIRFRLFRINKINLMKENTSHYVKINCSLSNVFLFLFPFFFLVMLFSFCY